MSAFEPLTSINMLCLLLYRSPFYMVSRWLSFSVICSYAVGRWYTSSVVDSDLLA